MRRLSCHLRFAFLATFVAIFRWVRVDAFSRPVALRPVQAVASAPSKVIMQNITRRVSLIDVISRYTQVFSTGESSARCLCPYHDDHNPSLQINEKPGYFYCFVCGESGNFLNFISQKTGVPYRKAFGNMMKALQSTDDIDRWLEETLPAHPIPLIALSGIFPSPSSAKSARKQSAASAPPTETSHPSPAHERAMAALHAATQYFSARLMLDPAAESVRHYLQERGIGPSTIRTFQLGFSPSLDTVRASRRHAHSRVRGAALSSVAEAEAAQEEWDAARNHTVVSFLLSRASSCNESAVKRSALAALLYKECHSGHPIVQALRALQGPFSTEEVALAGIATPRGAARSLACPFRDRLVVPITDAGGEVVAFGARELPPHVLRTLGAKPLATGKSGKYINSRSSALFQKGKCLFGTHQAAPHCAQRRRTIVVEGYFDVLSLHEVGCRHAVASMGTALSLAQLQAAARLCSPPNEDPGVVTLLLDNDEAGRAACLRAQRLLERGRQAIAGAASSTTRAVSVRAGSWDSALEFLQAQRLFDRQEGDASIKDCGDLCVLLGRQEACAVVEAIEAQAKEIGVLLLSSKENGPSGA